MAKDGLISNLWQSWLGGRNLLSTTAMQSRVSPRGISLSLSPSFVFQLQRSGRINGPFSGLLSLSVFSREIKGVPRRGTRARIHFLHPIAKLHTELMLLGQSKPFFDGGGIFVNGSNGNSKKVIQQQFPVKIESYFLTYTDRTKIPPPSNFPTRLSSAFAVGG